MKIVCVDNNVIGGEKYCVTVGKSYDADAANEVTYGYLKELYRIIDDRDNINLYPKSLFRTISEFRDEKLNIILE